VWRPVYRGERRRSDRDDRRDGGRAPPHAAARRDERDDGDERVHGERGRAKRVHGERGDLRPNLGYDLRVSNAGPTARTVAVRVASANGSTVALETSLDLGANESAKRDFEFPAAGTYEVTVTVGDARETDEWTVSSRDPDDALSVHVSAEGEAYLGFVAI